MIGEFREGGDFLFITRMRRDFLHPLRYWTGILERLGEIFLISIFVSNFQILLSFHIIVRFINCCTYLSIISIIENLPNINFTIGY